MKKIIMIFLALIIAFSFSSCEKENNLTKTDVSNSDGIDLDLSDMGTTMAYAQIFNVLSNATEYIDQNMKIKGIFDFYYDKEFDKTRYGVIIADQAACCAAGVELVFKDKYDEKDLPELGDEIIITGKFVENTLDSPQDFSTYYLIDVDIL